MSEMAGWIRSQSYAGLEVLHVLDEGADVVVGAEDLVDELFGEVLSEEGGEGGGGNVGGGEAEDLNNLFACIDVRLLSKLDSRAASKALRESGCRWIIRKSKKHEGIGVFLAIASNLSKKIIIVVFEHFTHQLVIVLIDELVRRSHLRDPILILCYLKPY